MTLLVTIVYLGYIGSANLFQIGNTCSKYISMCSIEWCYPFSYISKCIPENPKILEFYYRVLLATILYLEYIRPGNLFQIRNTCSKYISMCSIEWCCLLSSISKYIPENPKILGFYHMTLLVTIVYLGYIGSANLFQIGNTCSKYISMSSIEWFCPFSSISKCIPENSKILEYYHRALLVTIVYLGYIRSTNLFQI